MSIFEKLNDYVQELADKILANQDLCKLIHYPDHDPLEQPDVNDKNEILDKRLLLFTPKVPIVDDINGVIDSGTYVTIRPTKLTPSKDGYYIMSLLCFDIYCHKDIRPIHYMDKNGSKKKSDRAILIMDKINELMDEVNFSTGKNNLDSVVEITNNNATFNGYTVVYTNIDFRNQGV